MIEDVYGLDTTMPAGLDPEQLVTLMGRDKKARRGLTFVLETGLPEWRSSKESTRRSCATCWRPADRVASSRRYCRARIAFIAASSSTIRSPVTSIVTLLIVPVNSNGAV